MADKTSDNYKYINENWIKFVKEHHLDYFREDMLKKLMKKFKICKSYAERTIALAEVYPSRGKYCRKPHRKEVTYEEGKGLKEKLIKDDEKRWKEEAELMEIYREKIFVDDSGLFRK